LIGQGQNDPRVNVRESEQIVDAIQKNNGSVTYVVYSDEGHGFARPENRIDFNARAENFLAQCLGGRAEPLGAERIAGSTATVKVVNGGEGMAGGGPEEKKPPAPPPPPPAPRPPARGAHRGPATRPPPDKSRRGPTQP